MRVFDLKEMKAYPNEERQRNIFNQAKEFKTIIIELSPGGEIPKCEMIPYVIFTVIKGSAEIIVNGETVTLKEGQCLISEPATLSMKTESGVKIMGTQIFNMSKN